MKMKIVQYIGFEPPKNTSPPNEIVQYFEVLKNSPPSPPGRTYVKGTGVWRLTAVSSTDTISLQNWCKRPQVNKSSSGLSIWDRIWLGVGRGLTSSLWQGWVGCKGFLGDVYPVQCSRQLVTWPRSYDIIKCIKWSILLFTFVQPE